MTVEWRVPPADAETSGGFRYWPENLAWSTQLLRLVSYASLGAADFSEVDSVARTLTVGDEDAWYEGFAGLGRRLDERAAAAQLADHAQTASETWYRACTYYRLAATFRSMSEETETPSIDDSRRCFRSAVEADDHIDVELVEIPYESGFLSGYFVASAHPGGSTPTIIVLGGIDAFAEEMFFKLGRTLSSRGYNVLLADGPGQGEALRRRIPARVDYEMAISALVDFLAGRRDVDTERIGLVGSSLGGYFAARGAAFEHRLAATVIWGAFYGIETSRHSSGTPQLESRLAQAMAAFAVPDVDQLAAVVEEFNLEKVARLISCPTLILHGESDVQVPLAHAQRLFEDIPHDDKRLVVYPAGAPGCTHCQLDSPTTAHYDICNWLDGKLRPSPGTTEHELRDKTLTLMYQYQTLLQQRRFDEWIELWADDGICEFPFAAEGRPRRLCGKDDIYAYMTAYPSRISIEAVQDLRIHPAQNPATLIVEMKIKGTATETQRPYDQQYVIVAHVEHDKIAHYREYWNPLISAEAFS